MTNVTIVVPCYNEEDSVPIYLKKADELFKDSDKYSFDFIFINDGSNDRTLDLLSTAASTRSNISVISFSRNFGQDPAIEAGLKEATGDVVIPMDIDLQDPPELVFELLKKYEEGYDVVQPKRTQREGDSAFKKNSSSNFYKVINKMAKKTPLPSNVSQYKLLSRKAVNAILKMKEKSPLLRSEVPYIGFKTAYVPFVRQKRAAGVTHYHFGKMFSLAMRTITNTTTAPLDWAMKFTVVEGSFAFLSTLAFFTLSIISTVLTSSELSQYSLIFWICTIISFVLLALGILSGFITIQNMYIKEIMDNTQRRPSYLIDKLYESAKSADNRVKKTSEESYQKPYKVTKL